MAVAETFTHKGKQYRRIVREMEERWIVAADLGCSVDHTAIAVLHHQKIPLETFSEKSSCQAGTVDLTQDVEIRHDVRHLERLPIGTDYPTQVAHLKNLLRRPPLNRMNPDLVVDATGVGLPVVQLLDEAGLRPVKIMITAGNEVTRIDQRHFHLAKSVLISNLDAALHTGTLKFAPQLLEAGAMKDELAHFDRHVGAAGRATYAARAGTHDDLVLAVALAVWVAARPRGQPAVGVIKGTI